MDAILRGPIGNKIAYIGETLAYLRNRMIHVDHLNEDFQRTNSNNIKSNFKKCDFFLEVEHRGNIISLNGIGTHLQKVCIQKDQFPLTITGIC